MSHSLERFHQIQGNQSGGLEPAVFLAHSCCHTQVSELRLVLASPPPDGVTFKAILSDTPCCPPPPLAMFVLPKCASASFTFLLNFTILLFADVRQTISKSGVCPGASHLSVNPIIREPKVAQGGDVKTDLRVCLQLTPRLDELADNTSLRVELFCNGWFTPQPPKSWQQLSAVENTS